MEDVQKHRNGGEMEEEVKLSVSGVEEKIQLQEKKYQKKKRERFCALNVGQGKRSHGGTEKQWCGLQQQSSTQTGALKSTAREGGGKREVRRTFKMLREVWPNIEVEKIDTHKGVTVKALLDSGITGMFIDRKMAVRHGFKLQKLERLVAVRNVDSTNNSTGAITYQVEVNVYYKNHIERMRMDVCNLGRAEVIFGIPCVVTQPEMT